MIRTFCPSCKTPFDVDEGLVGQKGLCPTCGSKFIITRPESGGKLDAAATQPLVAQPKTSESATPEAPKRGRGLWLALLIGAFTAAGAWWLKTQSPPQSLAPWTAFFGETHPLIIHFPVALTLTLVFLHLFCNKNGQARAVFTPMLWINFLGACAGILAGLCTAADRAESQDLTFHTYSGMAVGGLALMMLVFHILDKRGVFALFQGFAVVAVAVAGHYGANLSHGDLMKKFPLFKPDKPTQSDPGTGGSGSGNQAAVFDAVIMPILNARCVACHGDAKQKGDLRLDTHAASLLAGESGKPSFLPGNPAQSESLVRIRLPLDVEEHMPPEKKPQVTPGELEILEWWVQAGADAKLSMGDASIPPPMAQKLQGMAANPPKMEEAGTP